MFLSKLRIPALALAASLAIYLTAGCGSSSNSAAPALEKVGNLEKTTLKVSVLANLDSAGFFVALHEGLFAAEGLRVEYAPAFSDSIIAQPPSSPSSTAPALSPTPTPAPPPSSPWSATP
jgi:ABC-type nitrate/sulfonate/bicarbonate transport system substrate-binding protein